MKKIFFFLVAFLFIFVALTYFNLEKPSHKKIRIGVESLKTMEIVQSLVGSSASVHLIRDSSIVSSSQFDLVILLGKKSYWDYLRYYFGLDTRVLVIRELSKPDLEILTPDQWRVITFRVGNQLIDILPNDVELIEDNRNRYIQRIDEIEREIRYKMSRIPSSQRIIVSDSNRIGAFSHYFGFRLILIGDDHFKTTGEINRLITFLSHHWVNRVFLFNLKMTKEVKSLFESGEDIGWDLEPVYISSDLEKFDNYFDQMDYFSDLISSSLGNDLDETTINEYLSNGNKIEF